ncbi:MAG: copper amine oxidase N-terminal domain-containing protein [Clostridia bacterium]|jgi:hypothetical protein|nr:copper amine oxidase N-terminal domain-containing protein [Clostridia bacterium]MCI2000757.1 copper amine oxidase N-terminal domain-containing protein [Clostridia bacterium]MCI2015451.1 copper amine oxidase N-terminal domain-containing protein [Clostridia bacterium]
MKKILGLVLSVVLTFGCAFSTYANTIPRVYLNNNKMLLQNSPFNKDGYNYIPLGALANNIGATLTWNQSDSTFTMVYETKTIKIKINNPEIHINSSSVNLEEAPILNDGVAYVPVRFIKDALGASVIYDEKDNKIFITLALPTDSGQKYDAYGRLERTTNLPSNASKFSYILNSVPNSMYSCIEFYQDTTTWHKTPVEGINYLYPNKISSDRLATPANIETWKKLFEKNLELRLNVDYRTVTDSWVYSLTQTYPTGFWGDKDDNYVSDYSKELDTYAQYLKDNHLIIEGDYYLEPSTTYMSVGTYSMRCWVRFRINSDKVSTAKLYDGVDSSLKTNTWYSGYADLECDTASRDSDGSDMTIDADYLDFGSITAEN